MKKMNILNLSMNKTCLVVPYWKRVSERKLGFQSDLRVLNLWLVIIIIVSVEVT